MPVDPHLPGEVSSALADFEAITSIPVQWGDLDAFGHVNNVVFIRWFESARIDHLATLKSAVSMKAGGIGPILASVKCDYKRQLHFPDTVHIGTRRARMGRTSVDVDHVVYSQQQQQVVATGTSVIVIFDYAANRPVRIPEEFRAE